jgi:hypothetical protein
LFFFKGRLTVEAKKHFQAIEGKERAIPIESQSHRHFGGGIGSRSSSYSPRDHQQLFYDSGRGGSASDYFRNDSRISENRGGDYLYSPKSNNNGGYRSEYEQRQTDANGGMRHEARREEFREEVLVK